MQSCNRRIRVFKNDYKKHHVSTLLLNVNGHQKDKTKGMSLTAKSK